MRNDTDDASLQRAALAVFSTMERRTGPPDSDEAIEKRWWDRSEAGRRLFVEMARAALVAAPTVHRLAIYADMSETTLDNARFILGGVAPQHCTIVAGVASGATLRALHAKCGVSIVEVAEGVLKTPRAWCVVSPDGKVWSEGC
jgi:hypothetical protein